MDDDDDDVSEPDVDPAEAGRAMVVTWVAAFFSFGTALGAAGTVSLPVGVVAVALGVVALLRLIALDTHADHAIYRTAAIVLAGLGFAIGVVVVVGSTL